MAPCEDDPWMTSAYISVKKMKSENHTSESILKNTYKRTVIKNVFSTPEPKYINSLGRGVYSGMYHVSN